jgi:hypothetical protein
MNAINVISPYKHHGMWVFDDASLMRATRGGARIHIAMPVAPARLSPSAKMRWISAG